jgi:GNAT superfamily N-acetyltransferase
VDVEIRPIHPEDKQLLAAGFERLSDRSRYNRFLAPTDRLTEAMLRYFTEVDHHDHEALLALGPSGEAVGVARYVRSPGDPTRAEAAITVVDEFQGRRIGSQLLEAIAERAREEGITHFRALVHNQNTEMLELLENLGPLEVVERSQGVVEFETPLFDAGPTSGLRGLLRAAARATAEALGEIRTRFSE